MNEEKRNYARGRKRNLQNNNDTILIMFKRRPICADEKQLITTFAGCQFSVKP